ncbi:MAG: hypothetical protein KGQ41_09680 [Alphaproteobacteria bacterium]|nr:hypothetical protein [Alphaproteobacteria bacterium]
MGEVVYPEQFRTRRFQAAFGPKASAKAEFKYVAEPTIVMFTLVGRAIKLSSVFLLTYAAYKMGSVPFTQAASLPDVAQSAATAVLASPVVWGIGQHMHTFGTYAHQQAKAKQQEFAGVEVEQPSMRRAITKSLSVV